MLFHLYISNIGVKIFESMTILDGAMDRLLNVGTHVKVNMGIDFPITNVPVEVSYPIVQRII